MECAIRRVGIAGSGRSGVLRGPGCRARRLNKENPTRTPMPTRRRVGFQLRTVPTQRATDAPQPLRVTTNDHGDEQKTRNDARRRGNAIQDDETAR
jgi:hypothetical protein